MRLFHCKGCGAQIIFVETVGKKIMPCNPELVTYWQKQGGSQKIVTPDGQVLSCELTGEMDKATGIGYISHFATCPKSQDFRRAKA